MSNSVLDIVEAAYDTSLDGQQWLARALEHFAGRFTGVVGCGGHVISRTAAGMPTFHDAVLSGVEDAMTVFGPMHANMTPAFAEAIFPTGTRCSLFSEHWGRVKSTRQWDAGTLEMVDSLEGFFRSLGGNDLLFSYGYDRNGSGVLLGAVVKGTKPTDKEREVNRLAAVHVAAGLRLRRAVARASPERAEAVLEADGRLAHAEGPAATKEMRASLRKAVEQIDRARTDAVRTREIDALDLWQGLVRGRWSLIDRHDSDGRRYYIAMANPPEGIGVRQLTEVEARVIAQVVAGEPNGIIAYSLGVAESTVAGHLRNAMRKLGARSRMDVVRLGRALGADLQSGAQAPEPLDFTGHSGTERSADELPMSTGGRAGDNRRTDG